MDWDEFTEKENSLTVKKDTFTIHTDVFKNDYLKDFQDLLTPLEKLL